MSALPGAAGTPSQSWGATELRDSRRRLLRRCAGRRRRLSPGQRAAWLGWPQCGGDPASVRSRDESGRPRAHRRAPHSRRSAWLRARPAQRPEHAAPLRRPGADRRSPGQRLNW